MLIENLMFALLRFEFFGVELSEEESNKIRGLGEEESKKLFALSKKHDMAHAVANALFKNGLLCEQSHAYKHYAKEQMLVVFRQENQAHELAQIKGVLSKNDIPFVILKGATIRQYYKNPSLRVSCDVDVLVKRENLEKATKVLCDNLGYTADKREYFHDVTLHTPSDVTIELHFSIEEGIKPMDQVLKNAWDYALKTGETEQEKVLTNEFLIFHVITHMAYHFVSGGCGIKPFIDLLVLKSALEFSQEELQKLLHKANLTTFYKSVLDIANAWFCGGERTELINGAQEYLLKGGVYGVAENGIAVKHAKDKGRAKYFWSRIFLPYDSLKIIFPVLKKHKWLFPFCQVARWFKALFSGRGKKFKKELEVSASLTPEQNKQMASLLKGMGL